MKVIASQQSVLQESRRYIENHRNPRLAVCSDDDQSATLETSGPMASALADELARRYGSCDVRDRFLTIDLGEAHLALSKRRVADRMALINRMNLAGTDYVGCNIVWMVRDMAYKDEDRLWALAERLNEQERRGGVSGLGVFAWSYHGANLCLGTYFPLERDWDRVTLMLLEDAIRRVRLESDVLH